MRKGFTRARFAHIFNASNQITHFPSSELGDFLGGGATCTNFECFVFGASLHEQQLVALAHAAIHHTHARDHTAVLIKLTVKNQRLQRRIGVALWRRNTSHHGIQQLGHTQASLC